MNKQNKILKKFCLNIKIAFCSGSLLLCGLLCSCGVQDSLGGGAPFCGVWVPGLKSLSSWAFLALEHRPISCGKRLSCSLACRIFLDPQGWTRVSCISRQILYH